MREDKIQHFVSIILFLVGSLILGAAIVLAQGPEGPDTITVDNSGRHPERTSGVTVAAQAGNVTGLTISHVRSTEAWQGYFGNISGTITLDDANNETMYDWDLSSPSGEVFASNESSVTWASIRCANFSDATAFNETNLESFYGISSTDNDGFSETFNTTYTDGTGFDVGTVTINTADACHQAYTYVDEAYQTTSFREVILTDDAAIVFTALLESNVDGFEAATTTHDFQMLVAEDGHPGQDTTSTNYYFFVELN